MVQVVVRVIVLVWYGSLYWCGTGHCTGVVRVGVGCGTGRCTGHCTGEVRVGVGCGTGRCTGHCTGVVRVVVLVWYGSLYWCGTGHCTGVVRVVVLVWYGSV